MQFNESIFLFMFMPLTIILNFFVSSKRGTVKRLFICFISLAFSLFYNTESFIYLIAVSFILYIYTVIIKKQDNVQLLTKLAPAGLLLLVLVYFKYFVAVVPLNIKTPLGISFITFEALSYIFDVSDNRDCAGSFLDIFLFISFFPKLVSGPIVLWRDFRKQIDDLKTPDTETITNSFAVIVIGLFFKAFVADTLSSVVDTVYSNISAVSSITLFVTIFTNSFYIYFDFLGYSYLAIGLGKLFGFDLMANFDDPYQSEDLRSFWRRWHISLNRWFVNYVFIPLGGNNKYITNILIIFFLSGIWHGNRMNFIVWGLIHGVLMIVDRKIRKKHVLLTFIVVSVLWIMFRADHVNDFMLYFQYMLSNFKLNNFLLIYDRRSIFALVLSFVIAFVPKKVQKGIKDLFSKYYVVKYALLLTVFVFTLTFVVSSDYSPFIYFGF